MKTKQDISRDELKDAITMWEHLERSIGRKLDDDEPVVRSCWNCNGSHIHLKKSKYVFYCFGCGKYYYKGKEIKK